MNTRPHPDPSDPFAADIEHRCRNVHRHHGGHPSPAWSTGEQLAVALVLRDQQHLDTMDCTPHEAAQRVHDGMLDPPADMGAWLDTIRAALQADPGDARLGAHLYTSSAVQSVARELHGDDVTVDRAADPTGSDPAYTVSDVTPVSGAEAARLVRDHATSLMRDYAERARGDGVSWADLAEPLGLVEDADQHNLPRAVAAYEYVVERRRPGDPAPGFSLHRPTARWTCASCGQWVTDLGPYEAAPYNCEEGHTEDCDRFRAGVAAYERRWSDS